MRCEVLAVGTELLLGQIVDTNSAWIGEQLALAGIDCFQQVKVGDNVGRIRDALSQALERSDAVIVCGGLGPTHDDVTRDAIAQVMGVALVLDGALEAKIRDMFASRGREMPASNLRQAMLPEGASALAEQPGTAPGLMCPIGDKVVFAVPGVPTEMRAMVSGSVISELAKRAGLASVIRSRVVRTWGGSEAGIAERLAPRIAALDDEPGGCTIAFLASGIEGLKVRLTAKASTPDAADERLAREVEIVAEALGDLVFSTDDETMEHVVTQMLADRGMTLATAESVTGGLVAARLTAAPGASDVFRGAVVAYDSEVKWSVLGVPRGPVVNLEAAEAMARGACEVIGADAAVATTGVAGPARQEGVEVGAVFLGVCVEGATSSQVVKFPGDRDAVQQLASISALDLLRRRLLEV